ncbi:MAG: putative DNA modification/repair radical SAM protein [Candidatus Odinarchaeota archaeon]
MVSITDKIEILGSASKFDVCASMATPRKVTTPSDVIGVPTPAGICHAFTPDGRCMSLFKVLMTNYCSYDCKYCMNANNCSSVKQKTMFTPEELARVFMGLYVRNYVEGLFLSSGVWKDADRTMEKIVDAIKLIRENYKFKGYMHIKILPGTSKDLIKQVMEVADRVSINVELPSASHLNEVSSTKDFDRDIIRCQQTIQDYFNKGLLPAGQTTQFIVGATDETDKDIIKMLEWEYKNVGLKRGYFTAFNPVKDTPLENQIGEKHEREVQLYRIDWLYRKYNYGVQEILNILNEDEMLPLKGDPKLMMAMKDDRIPLDVNEASVAELLRVPGIGEISAKRIVNLREVGQKITGHADLQRVGVVVKRARPFLIVNGKRETRLTDFF